MTRRMVGIVFSAAMLVPLVGTSARANSITTYGVIITALGNELQVQYVDQAEANAAISAGSASPTLAPISSSTAATSIPATAANDNGLVVTPNGAGGITVMPFGAPSSGLATSSGSLPVAPPAVPPVAASSGGSGSTDSSGTVATPAPLDGNSNVTAVPVPADSNPTNGNSSPTGVAKSPEPASITLLVLAGLGGLGYSRRRRG